MSTLHEPPPAKLFLSALFRGDAQPADSPEWLAALAALTQAYGPVDVLSPIQRFDYTPYYRPEMGEPLWRRWLSFERLVPREALVEVKLLCQELEQRFVDERGNRRVNLDPGLVSVENLVLASGKNITHRVYLRRGVYADLTLCYRNQRFNPLPWTDPDYASPELAPILIEMRRRLLAALKAASATGP